MNIFHIILVIVVGLLAGATNVIAGAGSLLTYPLLVAVGLPPVVANVTNDIGITTGNISGVFGLRRELKGQKKVLLQLLPAAIIGSILGACLLLLLPGHIFEWVAPPMLLGASLLTLAKNWVMKHSEVLKKIPKAYKGSVFLVAAYGGYFGSGIGLLFMALLTIFQEGRTQRLNAFKNVLQLASNGVAGLIFALTAPVNWIYALVLAIGSLLGAQLGARISQKISPTALRICIASLGIVASIVLFVENFM